ncbi:MAG: hypothetical protein AAGF28_08230 [Pseudomonadota bacterium]
MKAKDNSRDKRLKPGDGPFSTPVIFKKYGAQFGILFRGDVQTWPCELASLYQRIYQLNSTERLIAFYGGTDTTVRVRFAARRIRRPL